MTVTSYGPEWLIQVQTVSIFVDMYVFGILRGREGKQINDNKVRYKAKTQGNNNGHTEALDVLLIL